MKRRLNGIIDNVVKWIISYYRKAIGIANRFPLASFASFLLLVLLLILISYLIRKPKAAQVAAVPPAKAVNFFNVGRAPTIRMQAQIEKSGVVTITALSGGVVQQINFSEGQPVSRGQTLLWLSSNYQGGNALGLQRQIAQTQYNNTKENYDTQKDLVGKQRELANKTRENTEELRQISSQSIDETQSLIDLNNSQLDMLNSQLGQLQAIPNPDQTTKETIQKLQGSKSQLVSANNQLNSAIRNTRYSTNTDNPPTALADLQKDIALKQLDIQEKALGVGLEVSRLQLQLAQVNEALMYPASPINGTIQRVSIRVGQAVQPGAPLFIISGYAAEDPINAIAYAPREIAQKTSRSEMSILHIGNQTYETAPSFISTEAVQGTLYAIYFPLPDAINPAVTDRGYVAVDIPLGLADTNASMPFIPIDSVYQTEDYSYIYVAKNGRAEVRRVMLGDVYGSFVNVESGLKTGDRIILDRNVIAGDKIK